MSCTFGTIFGISHCYFLPLVQPRLALAVELVRGHLLNFCNFKLALVLRVVAGCDNDALMLLSELPGGGVANIAHVVEVALELPQLSQPLG